MGRKGGIIVGRKGDSMVLGPIAGILINRWAFTSEMFPPNAPIEINAATIDVMKNLMAPSSLKSRSIYL
jgi:hypothetical protein